MYNYICAYIYKGVLVCAKEAMPCNCSPFPYKILERFEGWLGRFEGFERIVMCTSVLEEASGKLHG